MKRKSSTCKSFRKKHQIFVATLCGSLSLSIVETNKMGITYRDSVIENARHLEDAMENTKKYLLLMTTKFAKSLKENS